MKLIRTLAAIVAFAFCTNATGESRSGIIPIQQAVRVLHFDETRNAISPHGVIAVCIHPNIGGLTNNTCTNNQGENQWQDIFTIDIPGHLIVGFEYRLIGDTGKRHLFLYFRKKEV